MDGLDMTAQAIAGCTKPVIAYVDGMACSAAYWLASQADQVIALSPAAIIGSIGLATEEYNDDEANARDGVAHRVYTSTDAPDKRPDTSTPEGRAKVVSELDALHAVFVRRVAEGRHVSPETVNADFGRGGVLTAEAAMAAGMIDDVIGSHLYRPQSSPAGVASSAAATSTAISPKEVHMDLAQLKAEHPEAYAAAKAEGIAEGKAAGIQAERERREKLLGLAVNAEALKAVNAAIASGASFEAASPTIVTAALKGTGGDNPPAVGTKPPEGGAGASEETEAKALASGIAAGFRARKEGK
jgi:ClpP class serine protease